MTNVICAAVDCNERFTPDSPAAKYCSKRCRWRANKQKHYKQRADQGLCVQCGKEMGAESKANASYCKDCQEYFKRRYENNKEKDD